MTSQRMDSPTRRLTAVTSRIADARALRSARATATAQTAPASTEPEVPAFLRAPDAPVLVAEKSRDQLIAEAAYLLAAGRGFAPGHELDDWLAAEKSVDARLAAEIKR